MINVIKTFIEGDQRVTEYTKDGVTVSHTVREPNRAEPTQPIETTDQKIIRLEKQVQADNLVIMETLATIFEEVIGGA